MDQKSANLKLIHIDQKKTFYSNQLLGQYKSANNQKKTQLNQFIQKSFQQALKHKIIRNYFQIDFKDKKRETRYVH